MADAMSCTLAAPAPDQHEDTDSVDGKPKRKVQKILDKNYHCPHGDCGKSYSRAEHLYRHQLNHAPKHIYLCDHPGCSRSFVRQDLCARHKERHLAKKSGLVRTSKSRYGFEASQHLTSSTEPLQGGQRLDSQVRRDSTMGSTVSSEHSTHGKDHDRLNALAQPHRQCQSQHPNQHHHRQQSSSLGQIDVRPSPLTILPPPRITPPKMQSFDHLAKPIKLEQIPLDSAQTSPSTAHNQTHNTSAPLIQRATSTTLPGRDLRHNSNDMNNHSVGHYNLDRTQSQPQSQYQSSAYTHQYAYSLNNGAGTTPIATYPSMYSESSMHHPHASASSPKMTPVTVRNASGVPLYAQSSQTGVLEDNAMISPSSQAISDATYLPNYNHEVSYAQACSMPIFTHDNSGPFISTDDFAMWLFDPDAALANGNPLVAQDGSMAMLGAQSQAGSDGTASMLGESGNQVAPFNLPIDLPPLSPKPLDSRISSERRKRLVTLIIEEFRDSRRALVTEQRRRVLAGDQDRYPHMLSLSMLQMCLNSYWTHVDPQLPIMHRPTYDTDVTPDALIMTQIALGASCLEASCTSETRHMASEFSYFLAWHIRYKLYQEADFGPPAKLWVFQTLILLEVFEKMYSTRELHERAHVHHATTIALMRRGSSLIGSMENAPFNMDQPQEVRDFLGSVNMSGYNTADEEFNKWISAEAMRRVAFAAFTLDTIHANMFGHSAAMVPHEMRIRLPCDEYMWSASSFPEVQQMQDMLRAHGHTDLAFDEALKRTLNGQSIRTNRFGRVSIMAGLLSVSWHLRMQDIRVSNIGIGKKGSWTPKVLQAFDCWMRDFGPNNKPRVMQSTCLKTFHSNGLERIDPALSDMDNMVESPMVLHHLAHMTLDCDVLDYQIYAGATIALGRFITPEIRNQATRKVHDVWAPSQSARDATFHALRFLSETLLGGPQVDATESSCPVELAYHPRNDVMLSRPWVLYIAVLVVWAYGYALDGCISTPTYPLLTQRDKLDDLYRFLRRVGGVSCAEDLARVKDRNACLGLLMVIRDMLRGTRWELLHDAAASLKECMVMLDPSIKLD